MMIGAYERQAAKLLKGQPKPKTFARWSPWYKRLRIGTQSLHRTTQSRMWRTFWRMKSPEFHRLKKFYEN